MHFFFFSLFLCFNFTKEVKSIETRGSQSRYYGMKEEKKNGRREKEEGMMNVFKMTKVRYSRFAYQTEHSRVHPFSLELRYSPV